MPPCQERGAPREVEPFVAIRVDTWEAQESSSYVAVGRLCRMAIHAAEQVLEAYGDLKTSMTTEMDKGLSVREMFRTLDHRGFSACQGEMRSVVETCGCARACTMSGGGFYGKDGIQGSGREIASPGGAIGQTREVKYGQEENHGFDVAAHSCSVLR